MRRLEIAAAVIAVAGITLASSPLTGQPRSNTSANPQAARAYGYYDSSLQRVVLVGGAMEPRAADRDRVWSWTGTAWELMTSAGPSARGNAGVAYDSREARAIVTGGAQQPTGGATFEVLGDTWQSASPGWNRIAGADIGPRDHHALVYDENRESVLLFGGIPGDRSAAWPGDTWELKQGAWARIATDGPAGRGRTALAYDRARQQVVLFGGVGAPPAGNQPQPFYNDTWVWQNATWRKVADNGPRARYAHGMVFDERAGVVLLYSGAAAHRDAPLTDMWQWDGNRWSEIRLTGPTPGYRYQPIMVYDRARGRTVLYGGIGEAAMDTWEWDGRQWRKMQP